MPSNRWIAVQHADGYMLLVCADPAMVSLLAALGAGFDCASEWEADTVLGLGVPAERIVFANACKRPCDIRYAAAKGLNLTTFDTDSELHKLARWHPGTSALLRIRADDAQVLLLLVLILWASARSRHDYLGLGP